MMYSLALIFCARYKFQKDIFCTMWHVTVIHLQKKEKIDYVSADTASLKVRICLSTTCLYNKRRDYTYTWGVLSSETEESKAPCHRRFGTIKIPLCSKTVRNTAFKSFKKSSFVAEGWKRMKDIWNPTRLYYNYDIVTGRWWIDASGGNLFS